MRTIEINQLVGTHLEDWGKWPDTDDLDYSDVLNHRYQEFYDIDDNTKLVINNRYYPVYYPYLVADYPVLNIEYPWINNLIQPKRKVMDAMVLTLHDRAKDCSSLYWYHAHQCFPSVARFIPNLFNFSVLHFGDDIPGSSDIKTFPVCSWFDVLVYSMGIWDMDTGAMTDLEYHRRGLNKTYLALAGTSAQLVDAVKESGFDIAKKAREIEVGIRPKNDLCFVGFGGGASWRVKFMSELNKRDLDRDGISSRLYGVGMRDGVLEPRLPIGQCGRVASGLYMDSLFGVNPQQSSIYNSRLSDFWRCGVVQLIYDPHGELKRIGFNPYEHYLPFNGTVDNLVFQILEFRTRPALLAAIIRNGYQAYKRVVTELNAGSVIGKMYKENIDLVNQKPKT